MHAPFSLLKFAAKAVGNALGGGLLGDVLFEVLPDVARDIWKKWGSDRNRDELRTELEWLAQADNKELAREVADIVKEELPEAPPRTREAVRSYLTQVPAALRRSLRRPADPSGRTVPVDLVPRGADDLLALLPPRLPHFQAGQRPLPGVDWELEQLLGVGGFGEVWKARNPHLHSAQPVALKFCLDAQAARSLLNETAVLDRVMRQGRHAGIVQLQHTYLSAEKPCLEYEYVEGGELGAFIKDWHRVRGGPSTEQAARVVQQLADIVGFAHRLHPPIVHRDLKPANTLLAVGQAAGLPGGGRPAACPTFKVADFGIGALAADQVIQETTRAGSRGRFLTAAALGAYTPLYASPQQMRGGGADPRDDIHALGVIWYQLLTGDLASGRPGGTRWHKRLIEQGMSSRLVDLLASCFEDEADDRVADAQVLAEQLADSLDGDPAAALPPQLLTPPPPPPPRPATKTAAEWAASAEVHRLNTDYDRASADATEALRLDPRNVLALFVRGESSRMRGDLDRAIADCTEVLRIDPGYYLAWGTRGAAFEQKRDYHTALADIDEALRLRPDYAWGYCRRGDIRRMLGDHDRAIADATEAIRLDANNARACATRAAAYRGKADYDRAIADATRAIQLDATYVLGYYCRGESLRLKNECDRAIADATQAIRLDPNYHLAYGSRGAAFRMKGDFAAALKDLNECLRLDPTNEWAKSQVDLAQRQQR